MCVMFYWPCKYYTVPLCTGFWCVHSKQKESLKAEEILFFILVVPACAWLTCLVWKMVVALVSSQPLHNRLLLFLLLFFYDNFYYFSVCVYCGFAMWLVKKNSFTHIIITEGTNCDVDHGGVVWVGAREVPFFTIFYLPELKSALLVCYVVQSIFG